MEQLSYEAILCLLLGAGGEFSKEVANELSIAADLLPMLPPKQKKYSDKIPLVLKCVVFDLYENRPQIDVKPTGSRHRTKTFGKN